MSDGKAKMKSLLTHRLLHSSQGWLHSLGFLSLLENSQHPTPSLFATSQIPAGAWRAQRLLVGYALCHGCGVPHLSRTGCRQKIPRVVINTESSLQEGPLLKC